MDNTLSKQGYFIIALTLSKKRERIPIPCNSNHLFEEPCILSWGKTGVLKRVLCYRSSMFTWFEYLILALVLCTGNVGIKPFQGGVMTCCPGLGSGCVRVLRFLCYSSRHSQWSFWRFGVPRITAHLFGFLLLTGGSRAWQETVWLREESEGLGAQEN